MTGRGRCIPAKELRVNVDGKPPGQGEPAKAPRSEWLSRDVSEFLLNRARETADLINDRVRRAVVHGSPPARSLRVLVIEDERDTLLTFTHLFTLFGHDVSFALTPATAIAEVLVRPPDV